MLSIFWYHFWRATYCSDHENKFYKLERGELKNNINANPRESTKKPLETGRQYVTWSAKMPNVKNKTFLHINSSQLAISLDISLEKYITGEIDRNRKFQPGQWLTLHLPLLHKVQFQFLVKELRSHRLHNVTKQQICV